MGAHRAGAGGGTFDGRSDGPEDLAGIHADDALIDAVHGRRPDSGDAADPEVVELLAAWRDQVDAAPVPELVSLDEAVEAVESGRRERDRARGPRSMLRRAPLVAAAAAGVIALGLGAGAHQSQPGDPLWPMTEVVFAGHADEVRNATSADQKLDRAEAAAAERDFSSAQDLLASADPEIAGADEGDREALQERARQVEQSLSPDSSTTTTPPSSGESSTTSPGRPGSSTPGPTTPGSTTPGSSTPGSSTPGSSTPSSSTPAPSAPSSSPGAPGVPPASPVTSSTTTSPDPLLQLPLN